MCRIYVVHDEVKDKQFELELSWVGEGECIICHLQSSKQQSANGHFATKPGDHQISKAFSLFRYFINIKLLCITFCTFFCCLH